MHIVYLRSKDYMIRHKTYITVGTEQYESRLASQYELAELTVGATVPLTDGQRKHLYRDWIMQQLNNERGIIWTEIALLADAADNNIPITIHVHEGTQHAPVIEQAIRWMQRNSQPVAKPAAWPRVSRGSFHYPMFQESLDEERLVWITGRACSVVGYIFDRERPRTAIVPGFGLVQLGRLRHVAHPFTGTLTAAYEDAILKIIDRYTTQISLDRYHPWRDDSLHFDPLSQPHELVGDPRPTIDLPRYNPIRYVNPKTIRHCYVHRPGSNIVRVISPREQQQRKPKQITLSEKPHIDYWRRTFNHAA